MTLWGIVLLTQAGRQECSQKVPRIRTDIMLGGLRTVLGGLPVVTMLPAFSAPFTPGQLTTVAPLDAFGEITREWAWEHSYGENVRVAVLDSGIDATHPDVGSVQGYVAINEDDHGNLRYDTEPHGDPHGHATACAAVIRSLAPACELISVKLLSDGLNCSEQVLAAGLRWVLDNDIQVCNLSLGTTNRDHLAELHELADLSYFRNVILVAAANNFPAPSFPSSFASVISVASHAVQDQYTYYYNPNPPVEFGAWGINVPVAWQNHGHITATSNSYAAPHVTGLVAKILGKHPGLTSFQVKMILRELANNVG